MNKRKLRRLRKELRALRAKIGNLRSRDLASFARKVGRRRSHTRTNEPTYVSDAFRDARPISIPSHPGNLKRGTADNILDDLEGDLSRWEEYINAQELDTQEPHE